MDLKTAFSYELSTYPAALGDKCRLLRPADKSKLINYILKDVEESNEIIPDDSIYIIDGGSFLHRIPWMKGSSFNDICLKYVQHIKSNFGITYIVVFDGYGYV